MNQKIQDVIDLFKSNGLITYNPGTSSWIWTKKALSIAESKGYDPCTNFTYENDYAWLLVKNEPYGFTWVRYNNEKLWDKSLQRTLEVFNLNNEPELPIELEDILL